MVLTIFATLFTALLFCGCGDSLADSHFVLDFPALPPAWTDLLGPPRWRVEWISPAGARESLETDFSGETGGVEISIPPSQASPILAWPFWMARGRHPDIVAGSFRPAGAIFPFDAAGGRIALSWQGGVDAWFYHALIKAASAGAGLRVPQNFDWPRFRKLFLDSDVSAEVCADPWTADWPTIAAKVVESGFDKRRFKPATRVKLPIPVSKGPWIGSSPFVPSITFEDIPLFFVRPGTESDTWYSTEGVLTCAGTNWMFRSWE
jgi:hypothetical protein